MSRTRPYIKKYGSSSNAKSRQRTFSKQRRKPTRHMMVSLAEKKNLDTVVGVGTIASTGTILSTSLNLIPGGTTDNTRVGRKVNIKSIQLQGVFFLPGTATAADMADSYRFMVYWDKQANKAAAGVTDILSTAVFHSFNNLSNSSRFQILKSYRGSLNGTAGIAGSSGERQEEFSCYIPCDIPVEFTSTTGAITEITSNNIGVIGISQDGKIQVSYQARIRYTDR